MKNIHTVIVPGVGGSDSLHWQSWLQQQIVDSSRVVQQNWNQPILCQWVENFYQHITQIKQPVQIVAHSFGCLTTIAALAQYPALKHWIQSVLLVAPANPARFSWDGFATSEQHLGQVFANFRLNIPASMVVSENDPWLSFEDAIGYAQIWQIPYINQGLAGHINVASGYGEWMQVLEYMNSLRTSQLFQHSALYDDSFLSFTHSSTVAG